MNDLTQFYGPNAGYVLELYERFQRDPQAVDEATRAFFEEWTPSDSGTLPPASRTNGTAPAAPASNGSGARAATDADDVAYDHGRSPLDVMHTVGAARMIRYIREKGHMAAQIDPLGTPPPGDPGLQPDVHSLTEEHLGMLPAEIVRGPLVAGAKDAREAVARLRGAYSDTIGYETDHIQDFEERSWIREAIESRRYFYGFDNERKRDLLERLTAVEGFERFLHQTFVGQKRFSLEGTDMLVPMFDSIIRNAASAGSHEVVIGMAHRGRLNVLAHVIGKPYGTILAEFQAANRSADADATGKSSVGWAGDVKYHLGARQAYKDSGIEQMPLTLAPNPSHLEFVNPVVEGRARAAQEQRDKAGPPVQDQHASLAVLVHGDAAFPGQGIVAETLNLSRLEGYQLGGSIHIITNNQIGFTTVPLDSRSTLYASDLAKGFEIPIVHVNADDPIACIAVARMAHAYREEFGKDFLIDLVGYRRWGHNEGDEPSFTQPLMYQKITDHPTVRALWAARLEEDGTIKPGEADEMLNALLEQLRETWQQTKEQRHSGEKERPTQTAAPVPADTAVPADELLALNEALLQRPDGFTPHARLDKLIQRRREAIERAGGIDWSHAEALAFAAILADGTPIRLSGQDSERGTFSQRHLVLSDYETGKKFVPLQALPQAKASFAVYNSPLSENAVLGFEYGYSAHAPGALVLWEAQFGDFGNGAQVIIDQFIVSGRAKWGQTPALVLLLPHGYEGQGPEHSSARIERFLQLAAEGNIRVANCTTSAQYFHLLRRQAALLEREPRPLVIFTPKSLLRHARASSSLADLAEGQWQPVILDPVPREQVANISRLIMCSGKVYVDLISAHEEDASDAVAIARVEQLARFPIERVQEAIETFPSLQEVIWLQEEPRNMGAWRFVEPRLRGLLDDTNIELRYVGRPDAATPSEGSLGEHLMEQARIVRDALDVSADTPVTMTINKQSDG